MARPSVTTGSDIALNYSASTQNVSLSASATESPTSYTWTILSVPTGSTALTATRGNFVNGVATVQNPSFVTDASVEGTYVIQCVATNAEASSDPGTDKQSAQQNIVVKTQLLELSLPNDYQYDWADYNNNNLLELEQNIPTNVTASGIIVVDTNGNSWQIAVTTDGSINTTAA